MQGLHYDGSLRQDAGGGGAAGFADLCYQGTVGGDEQA